MRWMLGSSMRSTRITGGFASLVVTVALAGCPFRQAVRDPGGTLPTQVPAKVVTHPVEPVRMVPESPREALDAFLTAAEKGDFEACWRRLASPLRERYTPSRLQEDLVATRGTAQDRIARARLASKSEPTLDGTRAEFAISERRAVHLVREGDAWKIATLE